MDPSKISANIRLRNPWEAIDLGFAMVRQWWKSIYLPLVIVTLCNSLLLFWVTPTEYLWLASLIFWWLKPLYDRVVLHVISRRLFDVEVSAADTLRALPQLVWHTGFFQSMTFRRLSLSRGFNLPIWQLEQLRGTERAQRQTVLHMLAHSPASWLTIALVHLEMALVFSLFGLMLLFMNEKIASDFFLSMMNNNIEYKAWIDYLNYAFYVLVVTLVHPFYIAGNFALYINRRTQLEAWDLELDFRKMSRRLESLQQAVVSLFLIVFLSSLLMPSTVYANNQKVEVTEFLADTRKGAREAKATIKETMRVKNLNDKKTITYWVKKETPETKKNNDNSVLDAFEGFAQVFGTIIEYGLWILLAVGLLLLVYFRDRWLFLFRRGDTKENDDYQVPEIMFGMDIRPDSLPDDIVGEARKLWQQGEHRHALSLMYRGALVRLINNENIQLHGSFTEGDVLQQAKQSLDDVKQSFLSKLTTEWMTIAYAHRLPDQSVIEYLFSHWHSEFAVENAAVDTASNNKAHD